MTSFEITHDIPQLDGKVALVTGTMMKMIVVFAFSELSELSHTGLSS